LTTRVGRLLLIDVISVLRGVGEGPASDVYGDGRSRRIHAPRKENRH
jgi:hypothetical protein